MTLKDLQEKLSSLASRGCWSDEEDFVVYDYSGSNVDDAYAGGFRDGETRLAAQLLHEMFGEIEVAR